MPFTSKVNMLQTDSQWNQKVFFQTSVIYNNGKSAHCQTDNRLDLQDNIFTTLGFPVDNYIYAANTTDSFFVYIPDYAYHNAPKFKNLTIFLKSGNIFL